MQGKGVVPCIAFSVCKHEKYHPNSTPDGFKQWCRHLSSKFQIILLEDSLSRDSLEGVDVLVFGTPRDKFSKSELETLKGFSTGGGGIMFMHDDGGECITGTNVSCFTEEYGISVNDDCVVCTSLQTCDHPKESSVTYCIPNRRKADSFSDAEKFIRLRNDGIKRNGQGVTSSERFESLSVSLPFCATLMVQKPATTILSTGRMAYPVQHAVGAVSEKCTTRVGVGRVAVLGSGKMAADKWFDRADNSKILDLFLHLLLPHTSPNRNDLATEDLDIIEHKYLSDVQALARRPRSCLQEADELPKDFICLFYSETCGFQSFIVRESALLRDALSWKNTRLSLIAPSYDARLISLHFASFPAATQEPLPPCLELFDLEEEVTSELLRLNILGKRNQTGFDGNIEPFVKDGARLCGLNTDPMRFSQTRPSTPRAALTDVFMHVMHLKSSLISSKQS